MLSETQKNIRKIKRNPQNIYRGAENPKRTWSIMSRGVKEMMTRSNQSEIEALVSKKSGFNGKKKQGYNINP